MGFRSDFEQIFMEAPNAYVILDRDFRIVGMNKAYLATTMREREDILGLNVFKAFPSATGSQSQRMLENSLHRVLETREVDHLSLIPYPIARPDGSLEERFWSATHTPIVTAAGEIFVLQNTVDVTEMHRLRELAEGRDIHIQSDVMHRADRVASRNLALVQEREYLLSLFDQAPSFMAVLRGPQHVFDLANKAYFEIVGRSRGKLIGRTVADALPEIVGQGFVELLDRVYTTGEPFVARAARAVLNRGPGGSGELRHLDFIYQPLSNEAGETIGILVLGHDVTEQHVAQTELRQLAEQLESRVEIRTRELEEAQRALRQSQKMEAIGNLAGGIAHDFNNLLQVITGSLQLLSRHVTAEGDHRHIGNAMTAARRGAQLAAQLLAFGRRQPLEPKVVDPGRLTRDTLDLLRRSVGEGIVIDYRVGSGLWNIIADPTNVETALLNLAINARDAMPDGGRLTIELANARLDEEEARRFADGQAGEYVMIAVSDTGHGIPESLLDKVFEPFFSTKPEGHGTGLGLSMVYGFVKQSGGHLEMHSEVGRGTSVKLFLPRALADEETVEMAPAGDAVTGGRETILVVEDDPAVQETVAHMLRSLGYRTLLAGNAEEGIALLDSGAVIDLIFSDVVMPGRRKSTDLAAHAAVRSPGVPLLFTSGYARDTIVHDGRLDEGVNFLAKPYDREQLARKLRQLLDAVQPDTSRRALRKVVLCEDDVLIRISTVEMLEGLGLEVIETGSVGETLSVFDESIDALITDMRLPDGNGLMLAQTLRQTWPSLPVVFATGDTLTELPPGTRLLGKPYDERMLQQVLNGL